MRLQSFTVLLAAAVVTVATSYAVRAEEAAPPQLTSYELDNGLQVILAPDHKVPKVAVTMRYGVGGMNEPPGRSGFAHLFEHLTLFAGTPAVPSVDATFTSLGITYNGFTQEDGTTYFASGMSSALPVMLSVHADQMANIGFAVDQTDLDTQRSVVLNEMRQNVLDAPAGAALTALQTGMFAETHPYHRAVIGSIPDLEAATLDDVRSFFSAYYAPNNAVLVVVGDFETDATKAMIEGTFGRIERGTEIGLPQVNAAPTRARVEVEDAVATPIVYLAFNGPHAVSPANSALYIAADLLGNQEGLLREELVNTGIAANVGAAWAPGLLGGRFLVFAAGGNGVSAAQLEAALKATVAKFVATPVDAADVERSRSSYLISDRTSIEAFESRAMYIARVMAIKGDVSHVLGDDPELVATTTADIAAAIRDVIVLDDASVAVVHPGPRGDYPPVLSEASAPAQPLVAAARTPVTIPILAAGQPKAASLPKREEATLSNGIEVIHYRMPGAPLVYVSTAVTGGGNNDPKGKEGLYQLAADMAWRGAGERDLETLGRAAKDIGATVGTWSGMMMSGVTLSVPAEHLGDGVDLLADVVQKPRFAPEEWEVVKSGTLNYLIQRDQDLTGVAMRALNRVVFFPGKDEPAPNMTVASLGNITLEDLKVIYDAMFVPATMVVYSVGDVPIETITAALEERLGRWDKEGAGIESKPYLKAVFPEEQQVYLVPMPGASQATIHIARTAPGYEEPSFADAMAVTNLLARDFSSRLNSVIREQKGYSYGVMGSLWDWYHSDGVMTVTIPVQVDATGAALEETFRGFGSLLDQPVTDAEVRRTITAYATSLAALPETAGGFFGTLVGWEKEGIDLDRTIAYLERMTRLDVEDVRAEAGRLALLDNAVIIIAGDPDQVLPQLEALGITNVKTLPASPEPAA